MKKMNTYLTRTAAILTVLMTMTACNFEFGIHDDFYGNRYDSNEARTLDGTWTGYIDTYFRDRFGMSGDTYRTTMYFERENPYGGWGYEVDYNMRSMNTDFYYCEFRWEVIDGDICIQYADSWNDVWIYDYRLDYSYFTGYMDDGVCGNRISFQLRYDSGFDWGYWTRNYTRSTEEATGFKASGEFEKE